MLSTHLGNNKLLDLIDVEKRLFSIIVIIIIFKFILNFINDPCDDYKNQSDDHRNTIDDTLLNGPVICGTQLSEGLYRFVTAVGTRTPTTFVDSYKCGKANPGWLILELPETINLLLLTK